MPAHSGLGAVSSDHKREKVVKKRENVGFWGYIFLFIMGDSPFSYICLPRRRRILILYFLYSYSYSF
jgi:hypothetical protein